MKRKYGEEGNELYSSKERWKLAKVRTNSTDVLVNAEQITDPPDRDLILCVTCEGWWHEERTSYERPVRICDLC
jgi:hypothetical protein